MAPTDFKASLQAIAYAFGLAQACGAKLSLLHVVELPGYPIDVWVPPTVGGTLLDDLEYDSRVELACLLPEAAATHVKEGGDRYAGTYQAWPYLRSQHRAAL